VTGRRIHQEDGPPCKKTRKKGGHKEGKKNWGKTLRISNEIAERQSKAEKKKKKGSKTKQEGYQKETV